MVVGGNESRSRLSGPAATSRWRALSATVVVSAPSAVVCEVPTGGCGMRPKLAFRPTRPVNDAGMRVDPPPSLAVQNGTMPDATAAADPPLDPPGVRSGFHGLRVVPHALVWVKATVPNSG